jgi:hypothetical protein
MLCSFQSALPSTRHVIFFSFCGTFDTKRKRLSGLTLFIAQLIIFQAPRSRTTIKTQSLLWQSQVMHWHIHSQAQQSDSHPQSGEPYYDQQSNTYPQSYDEQPKSYPQSYDEQPKSYLQSYDEQPNTYAQSSYVQQPNTYSQATHTEQFVNSVQAPPNQPSVNYPQAPSSQQFNTYPQDDVRPEPLPPKTGDISLQSDWFRHCSFEPRVH